MPKDVEQGLVSSNERKQLEALGSYRGENKRGGLGTLPDVPVGGHPGNDFFYKQVEMAVRLTVMLSLIGCMVWLPEQTKAAGLGRFAGFAGLAGCLMCFFSTLLSCCWMMLFKQFVSRAFILCPDHPKCLVSSNDAPKQELLRHEIRGLHDESLFVLINDFVPQAGGIFPCRDTKPFLCIAGGVSCPSAAT